MTHQTLNPGASANAHGARELFIASNVSENNAIVAENLAFAGLAVFPCGADKRPLVKWRDESTNDPDAGRAMWRRHPDALPAIDCGKSEIVVVDLDRHDPAKDGVAAFKQLAQPHGLPPGVVIVRTAGAGAHLYFAQPEGVEPFGNSKGDLPAGIDVRARGGFVIAPGSMLEDGRGWRIANGSPDLAEAFAAGAIPPLPQWLQEIIRPQRPTPQPRPMAWSSAGDDRERAYIEAALRCIPADDRDTWLRIGGALHDAGHGRDLWDSWSATSSKFDPHVQQKTWASFSRPCRGARATVGTIIALARQYGFHGRKFGRAA